MAGIEQCAASGVALWNRNCLSLVWLAEFPAHCTATSSFWDIFLGNNPLFLCSGLERFVRARPITRHEATKQENDGLKNKR